MIIFENVSFSYSNKDVIKNLSFTIRFNERIAILGESGEGKTTILRLIMGLIKPDSGKIIIDGQDITTMKEHELRSVRMKFSLVFQEGALFDSLNVKENVAFCLREYTKMTEEEIEKKVRELLSIVGVEQAIYLMPEELSGGMHRRVSIARSLAACNPRMFLYDEPTSGLDPVNSENICKLILDLAKDDRGFIVVTHKISDAIKIAERFMFLKNGNLIFDGNREQLLSSELLDIKIFLNELNFIGVQNV
jgi:phospholipid/cholesterol/gamma-HCH transport system ATP-binding protein